MTATIVTIPHPLVSEDAPFSDQRVRIKVHLDAVIMTAEAAMHEARTWLAEHVSELLSVATPELVVDDALFWRFDVHFILANDAQPGSGALYNVGQIHVDADNGEVVDSDALAAELRVHVASITP